MANKKVQQLTAVENKQNDKSKINWKVRVKNKAFWLALIPAVLLLIQVIASVFGYTLDLGDLGNKLLSVVEALFMVLSSKRKRRPARRQISNYFFGSA